jgi:hypothetical protein
VIDLCGNFRRGSKVGRTEPAVPDHAPFIRIGDGASFQRVHGLEPLLHGRRHSVEEIILEPHPADVQRQPQ